VGAILVFLCVCGLVGMGGYYVVSQGEVDSIIASLTTPTAPAGTLRPGATGPQRPGATPRAGAVREQWGTAASASSEYASPQFSARQAAGPPNTRQCADTETAWASGHQSKPEWLEISYAVPVKATKVVVYETWNPGHVVEIDLKDTAGNYHPIFKGPDTTSQCPGMFSPEFPQTSYPVNGVKVYVEDPAGDWAEIDAVQLVGIDGV
jgi:hypothetical protein